ncbi:hypothetical protein FRB90_012366 [Tulasnella sp. 427]|nr:hypothetical protein FRB90_012366 [Tulasnella sp. 427]
MSSGNTLTSVESAVPATVSPVRHESFDTAAHDGDQPTCITAAASTVHFDSDNNGAGNGQPVNLHPPIVDIEHVEVEDDPRKWSSGRKTINLAIISITAIAPALGVSIYNPAFNQIKQQLDATSQEIALSLSIFILIYAVGCVAAALAQSMAVLISMRTVQALGASVALTLGSGTIADMYDVHERGTRVGMYYAVPLLGPSIGPMLGGVVVQIWNWRATFWLMVILAGSSMSMFLCFKETFRKERSLAYQSAKKRAFSRNQSRLHSAQLSRVHSREEKSPRTIVTGDHTVPPLHDLEKGTPVTQPTDDQVKPTFADINPLGPAWKILKQKSNLVVLLASGCFFGFSYGICYTCARTFASAPYSYNALEVGSILLSFGLGNVAGSILGGRWSDRILSRLKAANGGFSKPEFRLESTIPALVALPLAVITYGWTCHFHVHVSGPVVSLFVAGFCLMWAYSSTLTYIVDSNPGRASGAIAMNSTFRGLAGLLIAEVSGPIQGAAWRNGEEQARLDKRLEKLEGSRGSDLK